MIVFLNGRYLPASKARVSALDRGLLYGDGLFETILVKSGRPIALREHLDRLRGSARRIGLPVALDVARWRRRIVTLVTRNRLHRSEVAVRLTVTRGPAEGGLLPPRRTRPTLLLVTRKLDPALPELRHRGVRVTLLPFHPGFGGLLAGTKTTDYLTAMIGKGMALRRGAFEGIYTRPGGEVVEGTTSNLFVLRRGTLLTPPLRSGVLPGVTRAAVLRLARRLGLTVREAVIGRADLAGASEAFLTASTIGVLPIREVDHRPIGRVPGLQTRRLQSLLENEW